MKLGVSAPAIAKIEVASRVEAWIEIENEKENHPHHYVASRVEAWIEIKSVAGTVFQAEVASRVEAWIEMVSQTAPATDRDGRLPRGGVD